MRGWGDERVGGDEKREGWVRKMGRKRGSVTAVRRPELPHPNHPNHPRREPDPRCPVHPEWGLPEHTWQGRKCA